MIYPLCSAINWESCAIFYHENPTFVQKGEWMVQNGCTCDFGPCSLCAPTGEICEPSECGDNDISVIF